VGDHIPVTKFHSYYIRQVKVVNGGGYIVTLAVCPSVSSL